MCRKKMAFWSAGPKCGNYFHAAETGRRWDEMSLSIPDICPCAIQRRSFELPYGLFFWPFLEPRFKTFGSVICHLFARFSPRCALKRATVA